MGSLGIDINTVTPPAKGKDMSSYYGNAMSDILTSTPSDEGVHQALHLFDPLSPDEQKNSILRDYNAALAPAQAATADNFQQTAALYLGSTPAEREYLRSTKIIENAATRAKQLARREADIDVSVAREKAQIATDAALVSDETAQKTAERVAQFQTERLRFEDEIDKAQKAYTKMGEIDPMRAIKKGGLVTQIASAIAVAMGAFASGINGGPNQAYQILNNAMDNDLRAQMANKESARDLIKSARDRMSDAVNRYATDLDALQFVRSARLDAAKTALQRVSEQAAEPKARLAAEALIAKIDQETARSRYELASNVTSHYLNRKQLEMAHGRASAKYNAAYAQLPNFIKPEPGTPPESIQQFFKDQGPRFAAYQRAEYLLGELEKIAERGINMTPQQYLDAQQVRDDFIAAANLYQGFGAALTKTELATIDPGNPGGIAWIVANKHKLITDRRRRMREGAQKTLQFYRLRFVDEPKNNELGTPLEAF